MGGRDGSLVELLNEAVVAHPWVATAFFFAFGLTLGSFANVVIYRLPRYCLSIVKPGSFCPKCETPLAWYDNIPLFAWALWLGRKCRHCGVPIPARYPAVELLMGLIVAGLFWHVVVTNPMPLADGIGVPLPEWQPWLLFGVWTTFSLIFLCAAWIDAQMRLIPDRLSLGGGLLALLLAPLVPLLHLQHVPPGLVDDPYVGLVESPLWLRSLATSGIVAAIAAGGLWAIGLLGWLVAPKEAKAAGGGMGLGDVKLIVPIAVILGWPKLGVAFLAAIVIATVFGLPILIRKWRSKGEYSSAIAFGPFLAMGAVVAMLWSRPVLDWFGRYLEFVMTGLWT